MEEQKKKILDFFKTQMLGVVSTIDSENNKPESAVVAFSETENLEIIFGTFNNTRKYKNLKTNPNASFVIGWDKVTVQYEGIAEEIGDGDIDQYRNIHLFKNIGSKKYAFEDKQRFFKLKPTWIRYSDLSQNPEEIFEFKV